MSLAEDLQKFRIANAINYYFEDSNKQNLYYTNEIIKLYLEKDKISLEEKIKNIQENISNLESEIDMFVPEEYKKIGKPTLDCARTHLEKIPNLEDSLDIEVEYWSLISDVRSVEVIYRYELPKEERNIAFLDTLKLLKLSMNLYDMDVRIDFDGEEIGG